MTSTQLPYHDIRVVEFTHMVMGPTCGMVLADLGADVIKVEPIEGDKTKNYLAQALDFFRCLIAIKKYFREFKNTGWKKNCSRI
jgi:crotonobetainyl-CoA:carnitine CoA-transferase CaiB-like acyl-CoA transferase